MPATDRSSQPDRDPFGVEVRAGSRDDRLVDLGRLFDLPPFEPRGSAPGQSQRGWVQETVDRMLDESGVAKQSKLPAAFVFFAEFLRNDLTNIDGHRARFLARRGASRLNLDVVYGAGPIRDLGLFDGPSMFEFRLGVLDSPTGPVGADLPRDRERACVIPRIGDPRNDANAILAQLHLAFLQCHNRAFRAGIEAGATPGAAYRQARQQVTWHYQWLVLHDFLPRWVGRELVRDTLQELRRTGSTELGRRAVRSGLPTEFLDAVFCLGPAIHQPRYRANGLAPPAWLTPDRPAGVDAPEPIAREHLVDWRLFTQSAQASSDGPAPPHTQYTLTIEPTLRTPEFRSAAAAILQRGLDRHLPSGQAVARALGVTPLRGPEEPLWSYVLREARDLRDGQMLGPVGGKIAVEALLSVIYSDPTSCLQAAPFWTPADSVWFEHAPMLDLAGFLTTFTQTEALSPRDSSATPGIRPSNQAEARGMPSGHDDVEHRDAP